MAHSTSAKTAPGAWSDDTVTNSYNNRLRTALSLAQPTGVWTNAFGYDAAKRLTSVTSPAGAFGYTFVGQASRLTQKLSLPNASYLTNTYDSVARLTSTTLKNSSHSTLNSHQYTYNAGNQRTQQSFSPSGSTYNYTYDKIGQLKIADSGTASEDRGYTYDTAWNLNYRTNNGGTTTVTVDGLNQLSSFGFGTCAYDANGNLINSHNSIRTYGYNDENQLRELFADDAGGNPEKATVFIHDGLGRLRIRREYTYNPPSLLEPEPDPAVWQLDSETRYLYDGWRVIQERNGSGTPTVSYTRGTDLSGSLEGAGGIGGLLARSHGYSSGNWSTHNFYHADGNGNITYLVNSSQTVAASYRYDPYGNTISSSGSLASANVYRFSSKEVHTLSGLYYYGYRFYEPNLQRWLNRDPIQEEGGVNLFQFVLSNPLLWIDPFGLEEQFPAGGSSPVFSEPEKSGDLDDFLKPCGKWLWNEIKPGLKNFVFNQVFELGADNYYSRPELGYPFVRRRDDDDLRFRLRPRIRGLHGIGLGFGIGNNKWSFGTTLDYRYNSGGADSKDTHQRMGTVRFEVKW